MVCPNWLAGGFVQERELWEIQKDVCDSQGFSTLSFRFSGSAHGAEAK